jgi:antibiotic biosynthesis monooxygenase (ABM) superfamily enzyme
MAEVLEMVLYRLKPDIDRGQFLAVSSKATQWLRTQPGYRGRQLFEDESGQWIDFVSWESMDNALAAATAFMETPDAAAFMAVVDSESVRMFHAREVANDE